MRTLRSRSRYASRSTTASTTTSAGSLSILTRGQARVPLWVGGRTPRSLRRAVELGDGWAPFGLGTAELGEMLTRTRDTAAWAARAEPIDVVLQNEHPLDPIAEPDRVAGQLARFADIGASGVNVRFVHHSREHYCEQLAALAEIAVRAAG